MTDFIRARSEEQKEQRLSEIKAAADAMFSEMSYHRITLTSIADRLGCSRTQVYKYVDTKEEIFLELCADKFSEYFDALLAAFPPGCGYSHDVFAEVWAGILNAHRGFLRYGAILMTVIETNVSVERLAQFKSFYYDRLGGVLGMLENNLGIDRSTAEAVYDLVYFQAVGYSSYCEDNPLVTEALELAGLPRHKMDFRTSMRDFISMCLDRHCVNRLPQGCRCQNSPRSRPCVGPYAPGWSERRLWTSM